MKTKTIGTILLATLFCLCSNAASVRLYFIDPFTNERDTNAFYITPIGTNVLSNGGVVTKGVTTKVIPASNGVATNTLAVGHYSVTNRALGSGVVIRVPSSSSLYDYTNLLVSGYNTFVTIDNTISSEDFGRYITNGGANFGANNILIGSNVATVGIISNSIIIANDMAGSFIYGNSAILISPGGASGGAGEHSIAIGAGSAAVSYGIAIGDQNDAFGQYTVSIGANSGGNDSDFAILIGDTIVSQTKTNIILIGRNNDASKDNQTILGHALTSESWIRGQIVGNGSGITNMPVYFAQLAGQTDMTADSTGNVVTNYSTSETATGFNVSAARGTITNTVAGKFRITFSSGITTTVNPETISIRTNLVDTHFKIASLDATNLKLPFSIGGIITLPANTRIDIYSTGDETVFSGRIFTVEKL